MTVAELLDILLDPDWDCPRTATVRVGTLGDDRKWEIDGVHGHAGGSDPEIVLEIVDTQVEWCPRCGGPVKETP